MVTGTINDRDKIADLTQNFKIQEIYIDNMNDFRNQLVNGNYSYFRGESSSQWSLNSSMVRKIKSSILDNGSIVLDYHLMCDTLRVHKEKYNRTISSRHSYTRFLFYMQHSVSFSPFIDLTKELWIAVSFCLENVQKNSENSISDTASIYAFSFVAGKKNKGVILEKHEDIQRILESLSIGINKLNPNKSKVEAYIVDSIDDLNIMNDRMQYQKGAFLLLNNYSIGFDFTSKQLFKNDFLNIKKFIISKNVLKELYFKLLEEYSDYHISNLYDPYRIFQKIKIKGM